MLYKIGDQSGVKTLEPAEFMDFAELGRIEKDLEALMAANLLDILFEDAALMPIFQERPLQAEADLYALDRAGDLVIFELKRGFASSDAMLQVLRYGQTAGQWTYNQLENKYRAYVKDESISLAEEHKEAFSLERPLTPADFNWVNGL
jgi:RecB family endonuclease NucS